MQGYHRVISVRARERTYMMTDDTLSVGKGKSRSTIVFMVFTANYFVLFCLVAVVSRCFSPCDIP